MSDLVISDTPNSTFQLFHSCVKLSGKMIEDNSSINSKTSATNNVSPSQSLDSLADGYLKKRQVDLWLTATSCWILLLCTRCFRFGSLQRFYSWFILTESESQSSLKFVIKTLDDQPKLLAINIISNELFLSSVKLF